MGNTFGPNNARWHRENSYELIRFRLFAIREQLANFLNFLGIYILAFRKCREKLLRNILLECCHGHFGPAFA